MSLTNPKVRESKSIPQPVPLHDKRLPMATVFTQMIRSKGWDLPYGGTTTYLTNSSSNKNYLRVGFMRIPVIEGEINIYGPGFILVWFASNHPTYSGDRRWLIRGGDEAQTINDIVFLLEHVINHGQPDNEKFQGLLKLYKLEHYSEKK